VEHTVIEKLFQPYDGQKTQNNGTLEVSSLLRVAHLRIVSPMQWGSIHGKKLTIRVETNKGVRITVKDSALEVIQAENRGRRHPKAHE
jgi:hypothetical protein